MENGCLLLDVTPHGRHYVEVTKLLLRGGFYSLRGEINSEGVSYELQRPSYSVSVQGQILLMNWGR